MPRPSLPRFAGPLVLTAVLLNPGATQHGVAGPVPARLAEAAAQPRALTARIVFGASVKPRATDPHSVRSKEINAVLSLESELGRKLGLDHSYVHFGDAWPSPEQIWDRSQGIIPFLNWSAEDPFFSWRQVADGAADAIIDRRAKAAKAFGWPIFLAFHHEPENDPNYGTPADYVAAWRHVVERFRLAKASNVRFVWTLEADTFLAHGAGPWYPGSRFIDYVAADGYNWFGAQPGAEWRTAKDIFLPFYRWANKHNKPAIVAEFGTLEDPTQPYRKAHWITSAMTWFKKRPGIRAVMYFDSDRRHPWWIDTSPQALRAMRLIAHDPAYMPPSPSGGTLLIGRSRASHPATAWVPRRASSTWSGRWRPPPTRPWPARPPAWWMSRC